MDKSELEDWARRAQCFIDELRAVAIGRRLTADEIERVLDYYEIRNRRAPLL
jgi:hypothetical protein